MEANRNSRAIRSGGKQTGCWRCATAGRKGASTGEGGVLSRRQIPERRLPLCRRGSPVPHKCGRFGLLPRRRGEAEKGVQFRENSRPYANGAAVLAQITNAGIFLVARML